MYSGINIKHERQYFIRATIEGICLSVNGSFATISFCAQIISDMFNKPVDVTRNTNSVSIGINRWTMRPARL